MKRGDVIKNVFIKNLAFKGYGVGHAQNREARVWGALPGECVDVEVLKKRRGVVVGKIIFIHTFSSMRIDPKEDHFLTCSPWQMMTWEEEIAQKERLVHSAYEKIISDVILKNNTLIWGKVHEGYRTKMEFSFCEDERGTLSLAFIERGYKTRRIPLESCSLAHQDIIRIAQKLLDWLRSENINVTLLKSLVLRSNQQGETLVGLFVKEEFLFQTYPILDSSLLGYDIYYSDPRSPMSRGDKLLHHEGELKLNEQVRDISLQYGLNSFFQVNIPLFEQVLDDIRPFVDGTSYLVDLYCGVGSIGITLGKRLNIHIQFIEENEEAGIFLKENCIRNNIQSYEIKIGRVELALSELQKDSCVILDPPRCGLHQKVIKILSEKLPARIIYLSCNIETQTRDISLLLKYYTVSWCRTYNFFPRTPHIEGLCVLERIEGYEK